MPVRSGPPPASSVCARSLAAGAKLPSTPELAVNPFSAEFSPDVRPGLMPFKLLRMPLSDCCAGAHGVVCVVCCWRCWFCWFDVPPMSAELLVHHGGDPPVVRQHARPALAPDDAHGVATLGAGEILDRLDQLDPLAQAVAAAGDDDAIFP